MMLPSALRGPLTLALVSATMTGALASAYQVYNASCTQEAIARRAVRAYEGFAAMSVAQEIGAHLDMQSAWHRDSVARAAQVAAGTLIVPSPAALVPADSLVRISVVTTHGARLFHSGGYAARRVDRPSSATIFVAGEPSGYIVRAELRPWVVRALMQGIWSWNRAQLVIALITLTAGLIIVTLFQLRRERATARMRSDFVANVSHELRTPLAQIRMFAEMLRLGWVRSEAERDRSVEVIDQEARRLSHLVENVLRFSSSERNGTHLAPCAMELGPFAAEVIEAFDPLARARGVDVHLALAAPVWVVADRDALRQILVNLLDNAVKYGPPGQIVLVGADAQAHGRVRLWVVDEGPGIPARDRARVWEPFHRLDRSVERATTGSGIGLSVVRAIAEAHGGSATIEDMVGGRGTKVVVSLPAAPIPVAARVSEPEMAGTTA